MLRVAMTYQGRVQGVGFRATVRALAARRLVSGWVRNDPDGSVRLEAQGARAEVEALLGAIRSERRRNITAEDRRDLTPEPDETGFEIRF